ncbi:hrq family protein [Rutstroemia sp. NJR-2017a BBW]|nr:hrq family protein [Rutstroemia sp. NJR-2017a BBW]
MLESTMSIPGQWPIGLGIVVLLTTAIVLSYTQSGNKSLFSRLHIHHRRASTSATPPRSLSPSKAGSEKLKAPAIKTASYLDTLPPSRRCTLPEVAKGLPPRFGAILTASNPSDDVISKNKLPMVHAYNLGFETPKYTPTGFSTLELKAMGDFPAYDILTGVPLPRAYDGFDPVKARSRPYRPLRWQYHQTMSITKMEPDWWLEVENTYVSRIAERQGLFREHGNKVLDHLPGSDLACKELMEMCLQFYCARYPAYFSLSSDKRTFHNRILHTTTALKSMHPLHVLLNNVPEDFAIVLRNDADGMYYFRAGVICSSLGWNVSTKIGMKLEDIHKPIPDYKEKMAFSMDRYFSKLPTDAPIQRGSWGLEIDSPLFMPAGHPHEKLRLVQKEGLTVEECNLRVDWQTLRRLPLSAGVVFNFKALFTPVTEFRDEPYVPALLAKILREGKTSLMEYKGTWHVEHAVLPALEEWKREQVKKGWVKEDWEEATLDESPYFPGWEEKWHRQQGF